MRALSTRYGPLLPFGLWLLLGLLFGLCSAAMAAWGPQGQVAVSISLGLDYLYLFLYGTLAYHLLRSGAEACKGFSPKWARYLTILAASVPFVGLCDAIENVGLIQLVLGSQQPFWAPLAFGCATLKFLGLTVYLGSWLLAKISVTQTKG